MIRSVALALTLLSVAGPVVGAPNVRASLACRPAAGMVLCSDPSGALTLRSPAAAGPATVGIAPAAVPTPVCVEGAGIDDRCEAWVRIVDDAQAHGSGWPDLVTSMVLSPDGTRAYVAGDRWGGATQADAFVMAVDTQTGSPLWEARYDAGAGVRRAEAATAIAVSLDGSRIFVTGFQGALVVTPGVMNVGLSNEFVLALDAADGHRVWSSVYGAYGADIPLAVVASEDGRSVLTTGLGVSPSDESDPQVSTMALDASSGVKRWSAQRGGPGLDMGAAVLVRGSRAFVAGEEWVAFDGYRPITDGIVLAYELEEGHELWATPYDGPLRDADALSALAVSPDGTFVAAAGYRDGGDIATVVLGSAAGEVRWAAGYGGSAFDTALGVAFAGDGVVVAGQRSVGFAAVGYDGGGVERWSDYFVPDPYYAIARAVRTSPDGRHLYIAGNTIVSSGTHAGFYVYQLGDPAQGEFLTAAYDTTSGTRSWVARHSMSFADYSAARAIEVGGGRVLVGGSSYPTVSTEDDVNDITLLAYEE